MLDLSQDKRTAVAWSAAQGRGNLRSAPGAIYWRRLLAELESDEQVLLLDNLVDGMRTVFLAVSSRRVLIWATDRQSAHTWRREHVQIVEHDTRTGLLKLSDGSGRRPVRLAGTTEQRRTLLRALKLPADAAPLMPATLDLRSHPTTSWAYERSPRPPAETGPHADAITDWLRRRTALAIVQAGMLVPGRGVEKVVAVLAARELWIHAAEGRGLTLTFGLADLEAGRSSGELWLSYDKAAGLAPSRSRNSGFALGAPEPVLDHSKRRSGTPQRSWPRNMSGGQPTSSPKAGPTPTTGHRCRSCRGRGSSGECDLCRSGRGGKRRWWPAPGCGRWATAMPRSRRPERMPAWTSVGARWWGR